LLCAEEALGQSLGKSAPSETKRRGNGTGNLSCQRPSAAGAGSPMGCVASPEGKTVTLSP
jgi:hypothetical protein